MNEKHQHSLHIYVNDVIALERDIINAIKGQLEDHRVKAEPGLALILDQIVNDSESRIERLKNIARDEGSSFGAVVKEGVTAVTGTLAGIYGKLREHPLSRMVRDDIIAMDVSTTSYGMLYTLGLSIGHSECAAIAKEGLSAGPSLVIRLTDLLPGIVAYELSEDAPLANPAAAQISRAEIRDAWKVHPTPAIA